MGLQPLDIRQNQAALGQLAQVNAQNAAQAEQRRQRRLALQGALLGVGVGAVAGPAALGVSPLVGASFGSSLGSAAMTGDTQRLVQSGLGLAGAAQQAQQLAEQRSAQEQIAAALSGRGVRAPMSQGAFDEAADPAVAAQMAQQGGLPTQGPPDLRGAVSALARINPGAAVSGAINLAGSQGTADKYFITPTGVVAIDPTTNQATEVYRFRTGDRAAELKAFIERNTAQPQATPGAGDVQIPLRRGEASVPGMLTPRQAQAATALIDAGNIGEAMKIVGPALETEQRTRTLDLQELSELGFPEDALVQIDRKGKLTVVRQGSGPPDPAKQFEFIQKLGDDWVRDTKEFQQIQQSYRQMQELAEDPSGIGDVGLVFSIMKVFDPPSVVREGEQATAKNAGGVPAYFRNWYNKLLEGEKLDPQLRQEFVEAAEKVYRTRLGTWQVQKQNVIELSQAYDINPDFILNRAPFNTPKERETRTDIAEKYNLTPVQ